MKGLIADGFVTGCRRAWLRRAIRLGGVTDAEIEFDAVQAGIGSSPVVILRFEGQEIGRWQLPESTARHLIEFRLPSLKSSGEIEYAVSQFGLYQLTYFKLTLANCVFYEEQSSRVLQLRSPPPIPAAAPPPEPEALPIPADEELPSL